MLVKVTSGKPVKKSPIDDAPLTFNSPDEAESWCITDFKSVDDYDIVEVKGDHNDH
jgi:hypothetical protein